MKQCIKRKTTILKSLKNQLKSLDNQKIRENDIPNVNEELNKKSVDVCTQTDDVSVNTEVEENPINEENNEELKASEWNVNAGGDEKSIEQQVKEVAQSAIQDSGMVYVESAGMYYDYKTGYYYNSELGLYYHTDTGCYYYYSEEKQNFVFHSYPDRNALAANAPLIMHTIKKAKKHKKAMQLEVDNLTKNFSQENGEESSKPKRMKTSKKIRPRKNKPDEKNSDVKTPNENKNKELEVNEDEVKASEDLIDVENLKGELKKGETGNDLEDGECSETDSEGETQIEDDGDTASVKSSSTDTDDDSVARQHPPCMRLIVRETNLSKLKVGTLFLITKDGGTVGREGDQHAILITDSNVSRNHLDIKYNLERNVYIATDLGSKNGTILNGTRMSESQDISMPMEVVHGSILQLGETKLLCHIHPGNDTCGHCEPGLIMEADDIERKVAYTRTCNVQKQHQLELARLKNKYAPNLPAIEAEAYNDRAKTRRETVGSSHHSEKTRSSDVDTFIAPENKGFKLLEKMGWSKGEGLGKDSQGDREPIPLVSNEGKAGLGTPTTSAAPVHRPKTSNLGPATLRLAARTKMLQPPAKAFQEPIDYDSE